MRTRRVSFSGETRFRASVSVLGCMLFLAASAFAEPHTIFLVRHAERAATSGRVPADTGLSREGQIRAQHLAEELKDAGIAAIFTTQYKRTQETAAPLADRSGIRPETVAAGDPRPLLAKIKASRGNVLVVGHSNTLPQIINALGVAKPVSIAESDYDDLFLIILEASPRLIHLHYR